MDANEVAHRKRMQDIIQRIPTGIPDGWEKTTYAVGGLRRFSKDGNYIAVGTSDTLAIFRKS